MCFHLLQRFAILDAVHLARTLAATRCTLAAFLHRSDGGRLVRIGFDKDQAAAAQVDRGNDRGGCRGDDGCCSRRNNRRCCFGSLSLLCRVAHDFGGLGLLHRFRISDVLGRLRALNGSGCCSGGFARHRHCSLFVRLNGVFRAWSGLLLTTLALATAAATAALAPFAIAIAVSFFALFTGYDGFRCFQRGLFSIGRARLAWLLRLALTAIFLLFLAFGALGVVAVAALFAFVAVTPLLVAAFVAF